MKNDGKKIIVLVEDERDLRLLYEEVLISAGYSVETAPDGEVAMDKIRDVPWDLLLLDIMLPEKDGLKILKDIQADHSLKKGPIITLTNLNSEHVIKESFSFGADGYLIKSEITPDKIVKEVESYLNKLPQVN